MHVRDAPADEQWLHQQRELLGALLLHVGLKQKGNWLAELHRRVTGLIAPEFLRVYCDREPTAEEYAAIHAETALALHPYRQRGSIVTCPLMLQYRWYVMSPVEHLVGFSIPSDEALRIISKYAPVVEVGAGTGYWSAALQERGVDVIAYDIEPPTGPLNNVWFGQGTYTQVHKGSGPQLFGASNTSAHSAQLNQRTLLMVWPNNADVVDNPHLVTDGVPRLQPWDTECLLAFLSAGGTTVVYVGEREDALRLTRGAQPDCGVSSSRQFQRLLREHFTCVESTPLPSWWMQADDLTVWQRERA